MVTVQENAAEGADLGAERAAQHGFAGTNIEVRLIRHAQTQSYAADTALTPRGEQQARAKGAALAGELPAGSAVRLLHAPTARATRTAELLTAALTDGIAERGLADVRLTGPVVSEWFDNFRVWCAGEVLEPTRAFREFAAARDAASEPGSWPGWVLEMHRFYEIEHGGGDPIGWWLTQPLQYFEPAASTVQRIWRGILHSIADPAAVPDGSQVYVCTHSGCIRAVAAAALGFDPGEPANVEDVRIRVSAGHTRALLGYREHSVAVEIPAHDAPWTPR